ncbi:MAG TPA: sensor histidine kinase, partial [Ktedonobacterales bacterium]
WGGCFFFTSAAVAGRLPWRQAACGLVALSLLLMLVGRNRHAALADGLSAVLMIFIIGVAVITVVRAVTANRELRAQREEMARVTAVMEERLRIARDLHDLLGHNLSLIALKSELARRLLDAAPQRAAVEIGEIEGVARTALQEVREAVATYRQPTLAGELRGAQEILALAGIACRCDADEYLTRVMPFLVEGVLAWTVREGVTNVIRHSNARQCRIRVTQVEGDVQVEVMDDGSPRDTTSAVALPTDGVEMTDVQPARSLSGNGLRGLAERVTALGGRFDAGPCAGGGFRLAVSVPRGREVESKRLTVPAAQ